MTYGYIWDGVFDNRDRYWRTTTHGEDDPGYPPPPGLSSWSERRYYKSYELSSGATDSVYFGKASFQVYAYTTPAGWGFLPIPFQAVELIDVNPSGGFWRAHPASYRIVRTGEGGDTLVVIEAGCLCTGSRTRIGRPMSTALSKTVRNCAGRRKRSLP